MKDYFKGNKHKYPGFVVIVNAFSDKSVLLTTRAVDFSLGSVPPSNDVSGFTPSDGAQSLF